MTEPLRTCIKCGLEAWTQDDLSKFVKCGNCYYGRRNVCFKCLYKQKINPRPKPPYLRRCTICGLTAWTEKDLELFRKNKRALYRRLNLCIECDRKLLRKRNRRDRLKRSYDSMMHRCHNPKSYRFYDYGGRGIENRFGSLDEFRSYVVDELQVDPRGLQCDRIDNEGHYERGNIRFVTAKVNMNNRRRSKKMVVV